MKATPFGGGQVHPYSEDEQMQVSKNQSIPVTFHLDKLSKARFEWIRANTGLVKPSGSMIIRRALNLYVKHLEETIANPDDLDIELKELKAVANPEASPWKNLPNFNLTVGTTFADHISEANRRRIDRFLTSTPFKRRAELAAGRSLNNEDNHEEQQ